MLQSSGLSRVKNDSPIHEIFVMTLQFWNMNDARLIKRCQATVRFLGGGERMLSTIRSLNWTVSNKSACWHELRRHQKIIKYHLFRNIPWIIWWYFGQFFVKEFFDPHLGQVEVWVRNRALIWYQTWRAWNSVGWECQLKLSLLDHKDSILLWSEWLQIRHLNLNQQRDGQDFFSSQHTFYCCSL